MKFLHCQQFFTNFHQLFNALARAQATQAQCFREELAQYAHDFVRLSDSCAQAKSAHAKKLRQTLEDYYDAFDLAYRECRKPHRNFNFWKFAFNKPREMACTYLLSKFMDANGEHNQGSAFFAGFLDLIDNENWSQGRKPQLSDNYSVLTEVTSKNGKSRMDLIIKGHDFLLIVEAKVYYTEHDKQIKRYATLAKNWGAKNYAIVYLTINGEKSPGGQAMPLSWREVGMKLQEILYSLKDLPNNAPAHIACRDYVEYIKML